MTKQKMSLLTKNMLTNSFGTVLLKSIPLITTPIISILLSPAEYGTVSIFLTWLALAGVFVGIQVNGSLQNALKEYGEQEYKKYCSSVLSMALLSFFAFFIPVAILCEQLSKLLNLDKLIVLLLIPCCFGSFCISFFSSYLLSLKLAKKNLFLTFFSTVIVATASLVCAKLIKPNYVGYVLGYSIPYIIIGLALFFIFVLKNRCFFSKQYWRFCLIFSLPLIFHMLSNTILSQSDKLMIQYIKNDTEGVGIYNMMHTISSVVNSLWGAMNSAFVPFYYDYLTEKNHEKLNKRTKNYAFVFTCITLGFMLVSPELTGFLINAQYLAGVNLLPVMILSNYFVFLYSFSVNFEFYNGKTIWIAIGTIMSAIINIILNYFLLLKLGIIGVAIATAISYFVLFIFHEIISRKVIKNYPITFNFSAICMIIALIIFALTYLLFNIIWARWIIFVLIVFMFFYKIIKTKTII